MSRVLPKAGSAAARFSCSARPFSPATGWSARATGCLGLLLLVTAAGCQGVGPGLFGPVTSGSGKIVTDTRGLEPFQEVRVSGSAEVVHVMADAASCAIEADDNLVPLITTTVVDGVLKIEFEGSMQPTQGIKIRLAGAPLRRFSLAGSGKFTTEQVDAEQFEFSVAGAGDAHLAGQTQQLKLSVSGSGKVLAQRLKADAATIQISGAGSADLHVESSLKVNISGAGSVKYSGSPQVSQSISGAGSVQPVQRANPPAAKQEGTSE
jgi:hypothetical protein